MRIRVDSQAGHEHEDVRIAVESCNPEHSISNSLIPCPAMRSMRAPARGDGFDTPDSGPAGRLRRDNRPRLAAFGQVLRTGRRAPIEIAGVPDTFQRVGRGR